MNVRATTRWACLMMIAACSGGSAADSATGTPSDDSGTPTPATQPDVTGTWSGTWTSTAFGGSDSVEADFEQVGEALTGTVTLTGSPCFGALDVTGTVIGDAVSFAASTTATEVDMDATVAGDHLEGDYQVVDGGACTGDYGTFSADR